MPILDKPYRLSSSLFFVMQQLDKDKEGTISFAKQVLYDTCNMLASLGNQSVLNDTSMECMLSEPP